MFAKLGNRLQSLAPAWLLYRLKRRRVLRKIREMDDLYEKEESKADRGRKHEIWQEWDYDGRWLRAELGALESKQLTQRAARRGLDIPQDDASWETHDETELKYLTEQARIRLRKSIRQDVRDSVKWWVDVIAPLLGAMTGIIGASIGL